MTIIYQYKVASTSFFGFFKLLRRWRGSVYKLMYKETIVFCSLYTVISLTYRLALNQSQRRSFEKIAAYCNSYTNLIPVSFVLGFYVTVVVQRWWQQFQNVPWPDSFVTYYGLCCVRVPPLTLYILGSYLVGLDQYGRMYRRTVARYMLFALVLILRSVSVSVMKRYPTMEHIVDAGFVTKEEVVMYDQVECKYNKFWVPLVWANSVITQARKEGRIESEVGFRLILEYIADFRDKCSLCFVYDWITIPLVYTQVVTLAVYMFFGACLIGRQYVDNDASHPDLYVPFFTLIQFFFYMGWLKVAEQMINPFGEDDDDYDMNWLIDRHFAVAMCLADHCHANYPNLVKDAHFNEIAPELPYTEAAMSSKRPNFMGSTYNLARPSVMEQRVVMSPLAGGHFHGLRLRSNTGPAPRHGSMWSLFGFKSNLQRSGHSGSRETISSMMNGHAGLGPLNSLDPYYQREHRDSRESRGSETASRYDMSSLSNAELPPEYVPLKRARATTDAPVPHRPLRRLVSTERERKWSFPLSLLRKKQERDASARGYSVSSAATKEEQHSQEDLEPLLTPTTSRSRFRVESVPEKQDVDASKQARNKQLLDKHMAFMSVSRPPVLSAIEEGNTIRSVKELLPSLSSHSLENLNDLSHHSGDFPTTILEETDDVFYENETKGIRHNRLRRSSSLTDLDLYQMKPEPASIQSPVLSDVGSNSDVQSALSETDSRESDRLVRLSKSQGFEVLLNGHVAHNGETDGCLDRDIDESSHILSLPLIQVTDEDHTNENYSDDRLAEAVMLDKDVEMSQDTELGITDLPADKNGLSEPKEEAVGTDHYKAPKGKMTQEKNTNLLIRKEEYPVLNSSINCADEQQTTAKESDNVGQDD